MKRPFSYIKIIILIVLLAVGGHCTIYKYAQSLNKHLADSIYSRVQEILNQQRSNLVLDINGDLNTMENIARVLRREMPKEEAVRLLSEMIPNTSFDNMFLVSLEGVGHSQNYEWVNLSDRDYFKRALDGITSIGAPVKSQIRDVLITPIGAPICDEEGEIVAIVVGSYAIGQVESLLLPTFGGNGRTDIIDASGDVIATSRANRRIQGQSYAFNFFEDLEEAKFLEGTSLEMIKRDMAEGKSGQIVFNVNDNKRYTQYVPLDVNDWYMTLTVDHSVVADTAMKIQRNTVYAAVIIAICFTLVFGYVYIVNRRYTNNLYRFAYYDKLTGLPNQDKFKEEVSEILRRNVNEQFACVIYDISNFKIINDRYGFEIGDSVLKIMAKVGKAFIDQEQQGTATISRLHTDTFAVFLITDSTGTGDAKRAAFVDQFRKEIDFLGDYKLDLMLGRYVAQEGDAVDKILEKANMAHANAHNMPPNVFIDYSEAHHDSLVTQVMVRNKVEEALKREEFVVFLQPKYNLATDSMCGAEALVRWKQGDNYVSPVVFIPVLERNGMIKQVDLYVFEKCCQLVKQWEKEGVVLGPISVNFSRNHVESSNLAEMLYTLTQKYGVLPQHFIVEFTETVTIENQVAIKEIIEQLHEYGFFVSMDDFGSGYSSLGFLREIPVDEIKLDRSFIMDISENPKAGAIVKNVISLALELGIAIVAEGVETKEQKEILCSMDCPVAQGYFYSAPVPCELIFQQEV